MIEIGPPIGIPEGDMVDVRRRQEDAYIRPDFDVKRENETNYLTRRGRVCKVAGCGEKVRYTKELPLCRRHEDEGIPIPYRGHPTLPGLKRAREDITLLTQSKVAKDIGKSEGAYRAIERCKSGVHPETRALLARLLHTTEEELLRGDE